MPEQIKFERLIALLLSQKWVRSPMNSKANLLTPACVEGQYSVYCRVPSKENRQLMLKRPKLPDGFQGRGFKGSVREGTAGYMISLCKILRLVGIKVKFQASSTWFQLI